MTTLLFFLICIIFPVTLHAEERTILNHNERLQIGLNTSVPPSISVGDGSTYKRNSGLGLTFTTNDIMEAFQKVMIDEKLLEKSNYSLQSNPLAVILSGSFLDTLSDGEHIISIVTDNGVVTACFHVAASSKPNGGDSSSSITPPPPTSDNSNFYMWLNLQILSVCTVLGIMLFKRRVK